MMEFLRGVLGKTTEDLQCKHKWSLPKQMVDGDRVFIGHRCKLCGEIREV